MAYKSSPRGASPVKWITGHSAEGARNARSLGAYFWDVDTMASSHVGIDSVETLPYVPYDRASWTLRGGNPVSDNAEICGFARWTRDQWLSTGTVDGVINPRAMLNRFGDWVGWRCTVRGIPIVKLSVAQVRAGQPGVIGHVDYTLATGDGTHTDPGSNFPWDYVMARATTKGFLMALSDYEQDKLYEAIGGAYTGTGGKRNLGTAVGDIWNFLFTPGWKPPSYGPGGNALISAANQLFYDTPASAERAADAPTYGPAINQQLADISKAIALLGPGTEPDNT